MAADVDHWVLAFCIYVYASEVSIAYFRWQEGKTISKLGELFM